MTEAIILSVKPCLDKDLMVELFTHEHGRIRAFAKYAQSRKAKVWGLLTTFTHVTVFLIKGRSSFTLKEVVFQNEFFIINQ